MFPHFPRCSDLGFLILGSMVGAVFLSSGGLDLRAPRQHSRRARDDSFRFGRIHHRNLGMLARRAFVAYSGAEGSVNGPPSQGS